MSSNLLNVSVEEVISRIVGNLKLVDLTYADDFLVWIPEAMDAMKTRYALEPNGQELKIVNHSTKLPCDIDEMVGILYNGSRLRYGADKIDPRIAPKKRLAEIKNILSFKTDVTSEVHRNQADYDFVRGLDLIQASTDESSQEYYILSMNTIQTSFEEGTILLYYLSRPTDDQGYPLIPDNESYKKALEWYCYSQMVFSGYSLPDPKMDYDYCDARYLKHKVQAVAELRDTNRSDRLERTKRRLVSLIPPQNYYSKFFIGSENQNYIR